jgi:hypothetical protein
MTDSEIIDLMYEHATAFSSCVQFSERAVRDFVPEVVKPEPPGYTDDMWRFLESADRFMAAG